MGASTRMSRAVDVLTVVLIVAAAVTLFVRRQPHDHDHPEVVTDLPRDTVLSLDGVPAIGTDSAPVVIVEFSDYQCPYCIRFSRDTFPLIRERLIEAGQVRYAFVHTPIVTRHPHAPQLSKAAICAGRQGLFWQAHERLFAAPADATATVPAALSGIGLDEAALAACVKEQWPEAVIARDLRTGKRLGVSATPTFIIGRRSRDGGIQWLRKVRGSQTFSVINQVVAETAAARSVHAGGAIADIIVRPLRWRPLWSLLPVWLLLAVVLHHRRRMHTCQQSAWKGGGFGMFSDINRSSVTAVLSTQDAGSAIDLRLEHRDWMNRFNVVPTEANLRRFGRRILQGRWQRSGETVVPYQAQRADAPLIVNRVTLNHFATDFDCWTGTHHASLQRVVVVDRFDARTA